MPVPMDSNQQNNYDEYQGQIRDPSDHEVDNIPQASIQHDGTQLPVGGSPKPQAQQSKDRKSVGENALQMLKEHMESGSTKTRGNKGGRK